MHSDAETSEPLTTSSLIPTSDLYTVRQFSQKYPAFPEGGLRYLIFHAKSNGFQGCIRRLGRKILINEHDFFAWIERQNLRAKIK